MVVELHRRRPRVAFCVDLAVAPVVAATLGPRSTKLIVDTGDAPAAFLDLISAPLPVRLSARLLERIGYGQSVAIVVRGSYHVKQLLERGFRNVHVVPDGVDMDTYRPVEDRDLRERLGLSNVLTVGICSSNFTWYPQLGGGMGWELVNALTHLKDVPVHAVMIGSGPGGIPHLDRLARELGVRDRLHLLGEVSFEDTPRYLGLCDVTLLTQTNDPSSWVRTTGKLPCYMACGRYLLASRVGTAVDVLPDEMLIDYEGTWDSDYPRRLAGRLRSAVNDPDRAAKGLALRQLAERFRYEVVGPEAAGIIRRVAET